MSELARPTEWTCAARLEALRQTKLAHTREKQEIIGAMDYDDWAMILPPPEMREVVQAVSGSGVLIGDVTLKGFQPQANHPSGGFFGPAACGAAFRALLEIHPAYVDPASSLLGGYCTNFSSYRKVGWNPEISCAELAEDQRRYQLGTGIGAQQHFCQDLGIGLQEGYGGILERIRANRALQPAEKAGFYQGLEDVVLGLQAWIRTNVAEARRLAEEESDPAARANLLELAELNERLTTEPPATFREACQWIGWYDMAGRMYNGSGSLGRLDVFLRPYYEVEKAAGTLDDEEAILHIASLLLMDTAYIQLGGPTPEGGDATSAVSMLVLEAAHRLRVPANVAVSVGESTTPELLRRGVEIMLQDKTGIPKFLGMDNLAEGFARNGIPMEMARERAYSGCHWCALPGREYTMNDCVKINLAAVFQVAWEEMLADSGQEPSVARLWGLFARHLERAVEVLAQGLDFHMEHMHEVFPELVMDLLCHGPIERGEDASHGGVEYTNLCVDGAALATVADSFGALEQRVELEGATDWETVRECVASNFEGPEGERVRLMLHSTPRYGSGDSLADGHALRIAELFTELVKQSPTPGGHNMIPGFFSWAATLSMGAGLGATPNGRRAGEPISHGANPQPGFRQDGAPTAMARAIAAVQPGWGNSAPMQLELDPGAARGPEAVDTVMNLIKTHMDLGGTQVNLNILDAERLREAHRDPSLHPELVVRVTGFSAYFASLSPEFRQLVVDRLISETA